MEFQLTPRSIPKYPLNDHVICLNINTGSFVKGYITSIRTFIDIQGIKMILYSIVEDGSHENIMNIPELLIFHNKSEVLDWAIDIANKDI